MREGTAKGYAQRDAEEKNGEESILKWYGSSSSVEEIMDYLEENYPDTFGEWLYKKWGNTYRVKLKDVLDTIRYGNEYDVETLKDELYHIQNDYNYSDEEKEFYNEVKDNVLPYVSAYKPYASNLYAVEIPNNNNQNYIEEYKDYGARTKLRRSVEKGLKELGIEGLGRDAMTGRDIYDVLIAKLGSKEKASKFFEDLGIVGVHYYGMEDGECYVIFNEKDLKITDHVRFFRTTDGEAYGFTYGGDIYIDPSIASSETPIHEYAHLWASALRAENKKEWKNVVDLMKGTSVWDEVKRTYPELKTDDDIADEVLATYSGRRGAERLRKEMDKAMSEGTATEREAAVSALQRVKQAIEKFWHAVADFLHIHYTSAEQVADQVMKDLLDGVDPREFRKGDNGKVREQRVEDNLSPNKRVNIVEALDEHGFKNYAEAKEWAKENIARTYDSEETGGKGDIRISNTAIDKYLSQSAVDKSDSKDVHLAVLKVLPNVIRESVDAEQHADYKKGEDGVRSKENGINPNVTIHRLYGAVRLGDKVYRVKVTLKEDKTSKGPKVPHSYEATKIELLAGTLGNSENSLSPSTNNSITLANLLKGVEKSYTHETFFNEGNELLRDGEAKDDSNSNEFGNSKEEVRQSHERVTLPTAVQEQVEAMHLGGEVEVVADGSKYDGKKRKAKGFYNKKTGKITIILGNHTSAEDVMQTLMHEAVAHKGLRKLFGKDFDAFLDKVFAGAEKPIREKIVALAAKNGWNIRTATEEYLASLAEDKETFEKHGGFWEKVRNFFYEMAHKLFPKLVKIGDNEMRYELWRSYENLKNDSSLIAEAKDIAMQDKLKVGNYAEKQGNTFDEDAMLYREERERVDAKHDYEMAMKSASHKFVTAWADSMYSLKQLQDIICKNGNTQIADWENAYMAENRMSSINLAEMETYKKTFYKDMLDAIQSLMKGGVKYQDVMTYMYAKHGLERNKYIQDEEIGKLQQAFLDKYGEKPISRPNDFTSGIDRNDYASDDAYNKACQAAVDAAQKKYDEAEKKLNKKIAKIASSDYSGLSSLFNTNSGFKTAAQQYVSDFEKGREKKVEKSVEAHTDINLSLIVDNFISRSLLIFLSLDVPTITPLAKFSLLILIAVRTKI